MGNSGVEIGAADGGSWRRQGGARIAGGDWDRRQRICFASHCRVDIASSDWWWRDAGLLLERKSAHSAAEKLPGVQSLPGPDPEAGCDSYSETHEVFEHHN